MSADPTTAERIAACERQLEQLKEQVRSEASAKTVKETLETIKSSIEALEAKEAKEAKEAFVPTRDVLRMMAQCQSNGETLLHTVTDPAQIAKLVENGADLEAGSCTPLFSAISRGRPRATIEALLKEGASPLAVSRAGNTILHAYRRCKTEESFPFRELVCMGVDINRRNDDGFTPLHSQVVNGHVEDVAALLKAGADPTIPNNRGEVPRCFPAMVIVGLKDVNDYADPTAQRTILFQCPPTEIKAWLDRGADPTKVDKDGRTPFQHHVGYQNWEHVLELVKHTECRFASTREAELFSLTVSRSCSWDMINEFHKAFSEAANKPSKKQRTDDDDDDSIPFDIL